MFNKFAKDARAVVIDAVEIARELGSPQMEAEHLLLAASRLDTPAAAVLREEGLDYDGILAALDAETARSLAAVGITVDAPHASPFIEKPRLGTSAKSAMERTLRIATARGDRRIGSGHVALGVLRAKAGTVPRALQCAEVDHVALATRLERAL